MLERTLVILKPDCIQRGITGEILSRFEKKGLKFIAMKMIMISREKAEYHYAEHKDKPFFKDLVEFIISSPCVVLVLEAENAIRIARKLAGATKVEEAIPGTIRGDYVIHCLQTRLVQLDRLVSHTAFSYSNQKIDIPGIKPYKSDNFYCVLYPQ